LARAHERPQSAFAADLHIVWVVQDQMCLRLGGMNAVLPTILVFVTWCANCCRLEGHNGRRKGGQGIVAFANDVSDVSKRYAIKFYSSPAAFQRERNAIVCRALQPAMPACHAIVDTVTCINEGPLAGSVLPPLIITERGESLNEYVRRSHPDFITSMQVRSFSMILPLLSRWFGEHL
jgi:hypothetical protein